MVFTRKDGIFMGYVSLSEGSSTMFHLLASLKLTFSPLNMDGWKMILSFWGPAQFLGSSFAVSFREGKWIPSNIW